MLPRRHHRAGRAQYAAAIAYHVLFSIFPLVILLAGVFGIVVRTTGTQAEARSGTGADVRLDSRLKCRYTN